MPYIKSNDRNKFDGLLLEVSDNIMSKGDLTYCLYRLCTNVLNHGDVNYTTLSTTMSCLEDAKLEWYRSKVVPYEEIKKLENGDVI